MKDNEIIQEATEAVTKGYPCAFYVPQLLEVVKNKEAEIEKKDTEIEILIRKKEALRDEISELTAEIEMIKSEAYREFAERLKAEKFTHKNFGELVYVEDVDNLVEEMTEHTTPDQTATNHSVSLIDGYIEE